MSRSWGRHLVSFFVIGLAAAAFAPGCAKNDESIYIAGILAPSANRTNGSCTYTDDPTQARLFSSLLDVGVRDDYIAVMLVGNQMIPRGDPLDPRAESNKIHIDGAVVRVTTPDGNEVAPSFTSFSSGAVINAQNNGNPSFSSVGVAIVDGKTATALRGLVAPGNEQEFLVTIRVFGKTLGGVDVESGEFQHPLRVCQGCLVFFPESARDPSATVQPNCLKPRDPTATTTGSATPCFDGQDEATSCQSCQDGKHPACVPQPAP
jgi:hypothetical protein